MSLEILDPTHESAPPRFVPAARLATLRGATVAVISNGKKGTVPFFDALERELVNAFGVARVVRLVKGNFSAPVETGLLGDAERWNALVAGIGD